MLLEAVPVPTGFLVNMFDPSGTLTVESDDFSRPNLHRKDSPNNSHDNQKECPEENEHEEKKKRGPDGSDKVFNEGFHDLSIKVNLPWANGIYDSQEEYT